MDENTALTPLATADNTDLAPEVRAELQALAQGARETIQKAWSPHTHRAYAGAWRRFEEWTAQRGLESMPAKPATLLLYLQDLEEQGLAPSTIRTAVSAVAVAHRAAGAENPTVHEDVKSFLRGIERDGPPQRQAAAMMPGVIAAIQATARIPRRGRGSRLETAEARARVDVALALTLRDGGLRISEAAALAWSDVERWPDGSGRLTIRRSKTDPTGEGAAVAVTPTCVRALDAIRPEDPQEPEDQGRVFQLAARQMANRIKAACNAAGLDGDTFSGHSGRVGLAWMMSGAGAPTETTMRQGRGSQQRWSGATPGPSRPAQPSSGWTEERRPGHSNYACSPRQSRLPIHAGQRRRQSSLGLEKAVQAVRQRGRKRPWYKENQVIHQER